MQAPKAYLERRKKFRIEEDNFFEAKFSEKVTENYEVMKLVDVIRFGACSMKKFECRHVKHGHICSGVQIKRANMNNRDLKQELALFSLHRPERFVDILEVYTNFYKGTRDREVFVITEHTPNCLKDLIEKKVFFPEKFIAYVMHELLEAIKFLYEHNNAMHGVFRLPNAENVFYDYKGRVKLGHFSYHPELIVRDDYQKTPFGSKFLVAPELLLTNAVTMKIHFWHLGILAFSLAEGLPGKTDEKLTFKQIDTVAREEYPQLTKGKYTKEFLIFVYTLLSKNPMDREPELEKGTADTTYKYKMPDHVTDRFLTARFLSSAGTQRDFAKFLFDC